MSCRRVLSSTPLLVRGSEAVGDSGTDDQIIATDGQLTSSSWCRPPFGTDDQIIATDGQLTSSSWCQAPF
jgi:hypothetical protein